MALMVFLAVPVALGVFSLVVALVADERFGGAVGLRGADAALLIGVAALFTLPLAAAAGAIGAVCGSDVPRPICCATLSMGAAAGIAVPWLVGPLAPADWTMGVAAALAASAIAGAAVCASGWVAGHRFRVAR